MVCDWFVFIVFKKYIGDLPIFFQVDSFRVEKPTENVDLSGHGLSLSINPISFDASIFNNLFDAAGEEENNEPFFFLTY